MSIKKIIPLLIITACMHSLPDFNALWDYNNPGETETKFRAILSEVNEKKHPEYVAELQTQIARTQGLQQKFEAGHQTLDNISKVALSNPTVQARYLLERGRLFNSDQKKEDAKGIFLVAYTFSVKNHLDYYAIDAAHMLAYAYIDSTKQKIEWEEIALKLVQNTKDDKAKKWEGSLYNNLGWSYFDLKEYNKALEYFELCKQYNDSANKFNAVRIADWSIAKCYRMQHKYEEALSILLPMEVMIMQDEIEPDGYVYEEIAECLYATEKIEESKNYFKQAYNIFLEDSWVLKNEKEKLERLKKLSQ